MVHKKKKKQAKEYEIEEQKELVDFKIDNAGSDSNFHREKRARLIVRNLPFANLSEDSVRSIFSEYGNIIDINLLKKDNGKYVGCGFIEFDKRQSAAKAIANTNGKQFSGRAIIVDWALPKNTFLEKVEEFNSGIKKEEDTDFKFNTDEIVDNALKREHSSDSSEGEEEEDDDEDDFSDGPAKKRRVESNDVDEGKTVFIKNVPFSATNEDVKKCASEYGSIVYALICVDKLTEHSKGTAFVKFKEKESAEKFIQESQNVYIMDQPLEITRALSKSKLEEEHKQKKAKTKDSRNLYLIREGVVMAGSPAAATVSAADMAKRLQIEQWKTQILRNLNMFVSKYRLAIHNLPADYDDAKFKELVQKYSKPTAVIKEARVMQNRKKTDSQGQPLSKELGFVSFTTHEDALYTLRKMNNNPNIFTVGKRPIISFSIENREVMNIKQKRLEKSRQKIMGDKKLPKTLDKLNRKQRRFIRRKEKLIRLRQESKKAKLENADKPSSSKESKEVPKSPKKLKKKSKPKEKSETVQGNMNEEDYGGVQSVPGKKLKMRSKLKLKKQAEIHKSRLKELKKVKKAKKLGAENKKLIRQREPAVKKKKKKINLDNDAKFSKIVNAHKKSIEKATAVKKWYDT